MSVPAKPKVPQGQGPHLPFSTALNTSVEWLWMEEEKAARDRASLLLWSCLFQVGRVRPNTGTSWFTHLTHIGSAYRQARLRTWPSENLSSNIPLWRGTEWAGQEGDGEEFCLKGRVRCYHKNNMEQCFSNFHVYTIHLGNWLNMQILIQ